MFPNTNDSLPPTDSQSNTAATSDSDNGAPYDVSPLTPPRRRQTYDPEADPDAPDHDVGQRRRHESRNQAVPRMGQNQELAEPPGYVGLHFVAMALFGLVVFLIWALAMVFLHFREKEEHTLAHVDRVFRLLEEQLQEGRDLRN